MSLNVIQFVFQKEKCLCKSTIIHGQWLHMRRDVVMTIVEKIKHEITNHTVHITQNNKQI